ncbi:RadC family protein [Agaribacterium haliotis]|uniref:RadC family protein n=1 Tax=Agaribacterium haliotis TaxID=2013869 RepID=UPI000BB55D7B|nr:DNA repair protein RadC [Agaribacterium haliotis]
MAIIDWPASERPREKLLQQGPASLSDAELLAIFLRTGCAGMSAVDLARSLLKRFGSLRALLESSVAEFCEARGLGEAKYSQLQAVLEMSRRHLAQSLSRDCSLNSSQAVKDFLTARLRHRNAEVFTVLFLDSQHRLIACEELFQGTIDGASVYPREVVKAALKHNSAAVILAHNHPSGIAEPSTSDQHITERLVQALALVDIRTLDHIIVGEAQCLSFAERGLI